MEGYSAHWEKTLMGTVFWRKDDERIRNSPKNYYFAQDGHSIHRRHFSSTFQRNPSLNGSIRRRRHFYMNELLGPGKEVFANFGQSDDIEGPSHSSARLLNFGSMSSGPRSFSGKTPESPTGVSTLRSAFDVASIKSRRISIDTILSIPSERGIGTPEKPFMYFRGGACWKYLEKDTQSLGLDPFWPVKESYQESLYDDSCETLNVHELQPLCTFRNLRVLKITGMMQSYQKYIWQVAWLNANLDELELEMALGPCLRKSFVDNWPFIKGGWRINAMKYGEPVYHGNGGAGNLNRKVGIGEYLDKLSIEQAKLRAMMQGSITPRLSIRRLTLTGFVVDADPFILWFDPNRLQTIYFKNDCVDAGFYLPSSMQDNVTVSYPRRAQECVAVVPIQRVDLQELKVVELRAGRKVSETPYHEKSKRDKNPRWKGWTWKKKKDENCSSKRELQHAQELFEDSNPKHNGSGVVGSAVSESSYLPDTSTSTLINSRNASSCHEASGNESVDATGTILHRNISNGKSSDDSDELTSETSRDSTTTENDEEIQKKEAETANGKIHEDDRLGFDFSDSFEEHRGATGPTVTPTTTNFDDLTRSITFNMPPIPHHSNHHHHHRHRLKLLSWMEKHMK